MGTSDIIASVSLLFSVVSGIYSLYIGRKLNKQQIQINKQTLSLHKMKKMRKKHLYAPMPLKQEVGGMENKSIQ